MGRFLVENTVVRLLSKFAVGDERFTVEGYVGDLRRTERLDGFSVCDISCGSGMLLGYAFDALVRAYEERGYLAREIPRLVLLNNIVGIDIDLRAAQMSELQLGIRARAIDRRFYSRGGSPHVVCLDDSSLPMGSLSMAEEGLQVPEELRRSYDVVLCDPPFMGSGNYTTEQSKWMRAHYPDCFKDVASAFAERAASLARDGGMCGVILPLVWMYVESYAKARRRMLKERAITTVVQLERAPGVRGWGELCLMVFSNTKASAPTVYINVGTCADEERQALITSSAAKDESDSHRFEATQEMMLSTPRASMSFMMSPAAFSALDRFPSVGESVRMVNGLSTGNNERFIRKWWEVSVSSHRLSSSDVSARWYPCSNGGGFRKWFGHVDDCVDWGDNGLRLRTAPGSAVRNEEWYLRENVGWGKGSAEAFSARLYPAGGLFTATGLTAIGKTHEENLLLLGLLNSSVARYFIRNLTPTQSKSTGDVGKLPLSYGFRESVVLHLVSECVALVRADSATDECSPVRSRVRLLRNYPVGRD